MEFSSDQFDSKVDSIPEFSSHNNEGFNVGTQQNTNNNTNLNSTNYFSSALSDKMNEMGEELID